MDGHEPRRPHPPQPSQPSQPPYFPHTQHSHHPPYPPHPPRQTRRRWLTVTVAAVGYVLGTALTKQLFSGGLSLLFGVIFVVVFVLLLRWAWLSESDE